MASCTPVRVRAACVFGVADLSRSRILGTGRASPTAAISQSGKAARRRASETSRRVWQRGKISGSQTIVPRLIAADADLDRICRVEVISDDVHTELTLPRDLVRMRDIARGVDAVLLILESLISRLDGKLDSHKDADVRRALEPLVATADLINIAVLGLIHHNKSRSSDPLQVIMASKAFTAVARSVHTVIYDPDDNTNARRLFGTPKNNLGEVIFQR